MLSLCVLNWNFKTFFNWHLRTHVYRSKESERTSNRAHCLCPKFLPPWMKFTGDPPLDATSPHQNHTPQHDCTVPFPSATESQRASDLPNYRPWFLPMPPHPNTLLGSPGSAAGSTVLILPWGGTHVLVPGWGNQLTTLQPQARLTQQGPGPCKSMALLPLGARGITPYVRQ